MVARPRVPYFSFLSITLFLAITLSVIGLFPIGFFPIGLFQLELLAPISLPAAYAEKPPLPASAPPLDYRIQCRYFPERTTIVGRVDLTWPFPGAQPLEQLALHLYPNAFRPGSTFRKESSGKHRGYTAGQGDDGEMEVTRITANYDGESIDVTKSLRYIQPDDNNLNDKTLAAVDLPRPLRPGQRLELAIEFRTRLPRVYARSGTAGPFVMAGQWYPKLAAFERYGQRGRTREGFNLHQFHANSEFYANFANYDVQITLPKGYTVGATGQETAPPVVQDGLQTVRFGQAWVHDFAWSADPRFRLFTRTVTPQGGRPVEIRLYCQKDHVHTADRQLDAVAAALEGLAAYGPYPYAVLTVIDPPADAPGAGGMEYPTLITGGTPSFPGERSAEPDRLLIHEAAHQYWYGLVASNEFEEAWLDEGLTTYTEGKILERYKADTRIPVRFFGFPLLYSPLRDGCPGLFRAALGPWVPDPIRLDSWKFASEQSYAVSVYNRAALALYSLERLIGEEKMQAILSTYCSRWSFRHPGTEDFLRIVAEKAGDRAAKLFQQWLSTPGALDYAVGSVRMAKGPDGPVWTIRIDRRGELGAPVEVAVIGKDGQRQQFFWDDGERYKEFTLPGTAPEAVVVDPGEKLALDINRLNNFWAKEQNNAAALRWSLFVAAVCQGLMAVGL
ncbi:aminopeptidase, m1 family, putative [Heliomicrobium modesticaldum Ice1]|uniref:Aminopeptidase, m1 family, putative n=1 Tax=Heliobacterium modesticaldum (strain ATCC 51547 / Ice1) TaxID=498761 RepID=B0TF54_HELMI|nr:M1 family metallopeptidase [Heliomicrobium modesticaldum]ABZ83037.1 aminopeptidase, m1 family, putative [Heliomicrobium modesticaldum Ice1]